MFKMKRKRNKTTEPEDCRGKEKQRKLVKREKQTAVEKTTKGRRNGRILDDQQDQEERADQDQVLCKKQKRITRNDLDRMRHVQQDRATRISHAQVSTNWQDQSAQVCEDQRIASSREEVEENPVVKEFLAIVDAILEATSDVDLAEIMENDAEDGDVSALLSSSESLLDGSLLKSISLASGRLKCCGLTNKVPFKQLVQLMRVLHLCLNMGNVLLPLSKLESDITEGSSTDREAVIERLLSSLDASLTILNIMTSTDMPKEVYLEEVILLVVQVAKAHLENILYPQFDPLYKTDQQFGRSTLKSRKSKGATVVRDKSMLQMYASLTQIVTLLSDFVDIQELTDTVVLQASSLAVSPFFVENVYELQLVAIKLTYRIFSRYEKHQQLILEDILSVLAKLPCSKKNIKTFRISGSGVQVQMLTALTLQLVQSVVKVPKETFDNGYQDNKEMSPEMTDAMANLLLSYEKGLKTAHVFLSLFLSKCTIKSEDDYRPLFENFVMDLLEMAHHPEWPAVEPVLVLLVNLLVKQFGTRSVDMTARVAALGYLGLIAARLRKDAATNNRDVDVVNHILAQQGHHNSDTGQKMICLQKLLLNYLTSKSKTDSSLDFSWQFYMAQWCSDHFRTTSSSSFSASSTSSAPQTVKNSSGTSKKTTAKCIYPTYLSLSMKTYLSSKEMLSSESAMAVARYLAANLSFSQCADICLMQILLILGETTTAIRSKAMKCLAGVIEADAKILSKVEVQEAVHGRCLDQSTSVRDAAVDLIGKNVLQHQQLIDTYYGMLSERILDTGISVRKRVIAIFRDICLRHPAYPKVPDMCVQMIRRIGDEEGVKKLVTETFESMWFTHLHHSDTSAIKQCVDNIVSVVAACQHSSFIDWLEQLISNVLKKGKDARNTAITTTCQLIVSGLVQNAAILTDQIKVENGSATDSSRLVACFSSLYIFCKVKPEFLIPHCNDLHVYLDYDLMPQLDSVIRHHAIHILEMVLPRVILPDDAFLTLIEDYLMKLILSQGMLIVQRSFSCLTTLIKSVTHNYEPIRCYFQRFFRLLVYLMTEHMKDSSNSALETSRPMLLRSLFIIGLLCEHFECGEFGDDVEGLSDRIFHTLFYFTHHEVEEVQHKAVTAIGHMTIRHSDLMLGKTLKDLYIQLLTDSGLSVRLCCQVLKNIQMYLAEEESKMMKADKRWKDNHDQISLKEMADIQSGMGSAIIQVYLKHVLKLFFSADIGVRSVALDVITTVLHQGLIHPAQCVPYLICMGSDTDPAINQKADHWLKEIDKKYPGFIQMKALQGIRLSYQLQQKLQGSAAAESVRGLRPSSKPSCLNSYVYTLLRTNRGQRRVFLNSLLKLFDDSQDTELRELVYVADCFSGFPFQQLDEVLFLIHQLDAIVSISGSNVLQSYTKIVYPNEEDRTKMEEEDVEEDVDSLLDCLPKDVSRLKRLYVTSQRYQLLMILKKYLKSTYGISDKTIQHYSPADGAKLYDKPLNAKNNAKFNPTTALDVLRQPDVSRTELVEAYLSFKDLMMTIDTAADKEDKVSQVQSSGMSLVCC